MSAESGAYYGEDLMCLIFQGGDGSGDTGQQGRFRDHGWLWCRCLWYKPLYSHLCNVNML